MGEFDGLSALVTGGASGIGLAIADALADRGAKVAILDRDVSGATGGPHLTFAADVTDDAAVRAAVAAAAEAMGGIDILVNNAGIGAVGGIEDNPYEEWLRVLDVNVLGIVRVTRAALPELRKSSDAAIVNTCSIAATVGLPQRAAYTASKGAVLSLTMGMAAELLPERIRVNAVNPGTPRTPPGSGVCSPAQPIPTPSTERSSPASRMGGSSQPPRWRTLSPISPPRWQAPPPAPGWRWTAAWTDSD